MLPKSKKVKFKNFFIYLEYFITFQAKGRKFFKTIECFVLSTHTICFTIFPISMHFGWPEKRANSRKKITYIKGMEGVLCTKMSVTQIFIWKSKWNNISFFKEVVSLFQTPKFQNSIPYILEFIWHRYMHNCKMNVLCASFYFFSPLSPKCKDYRHMI